MKAISSNFKQFQLVLLILFLPFGMYCQMYECQTPEDGITPQSVGQNCFGGGYGPLPKSGCSNYTSYSPNTPLFTPLKNIRVIFHVFQDDEGQRNFQDEWFTRWEFSNSIDALNGIFGMNDVIIVPDSIECQGDSLRDTRIRFSFDKDNDIHYYNDTDAWQGGEAYGPNGNAIGGCDLWDLYVTNNNDLTNQDKDEALHIFITGCAIDDSLQQNFGFGGYSPGIPVNNEKFIVTKGYYRGRVEADTTYVWPGNAALLYAHEIGHALSLRHSNNFDFCCDTKSGFLSNSLMDSESHSGGFSECQIARMHYVLEGKCGLSGSCSDAYKLDITDYCNKNEEYDIIIQDGEHIVWDVDKKINTDIIIETGGQLTIKCNLGMPTDGRIEVQRGARLFVDEGTITHNKSKWHQCNEGKWDGVYVAGNPNQGQNSYMSYETYPLVPDGTGFAIFKGATIEYAFNGCRNHLPEEGNPNVNNGGFIYAENSSFRNNNTGVTFFPYEHYTASSFVNCDFIGDGPDEEAFVGIFSVENQGIVVTDCDFEGLLSYGIGAANSTMTIQKSRFNKNNVGILGGATTMFNTILLVGGEQEELGNSFTQNSVGVEGNALKDLTVKHNKFENNEFGVAVKGLSDFNISHNTFEGNTNVGIDLSQTGDSGEDIVACNVHFDDFKAMEITGDNRGVAFDNNDYTYSDYDVYLTEEEDGANVFPGEVSIQGWVARPRYNRYSTVQNNRHISTVGNTEQFIYFHPDPNDFPRTKPMCDLLDNNPVCNLFQNDFLNIQTNGPEASCDSNIGSEDPCQKIPCYQELSNSINNAGAVTTENMVELANLNKRKSIVKWTLVNQFLKEENWIALEELRAIDNDNDILKAKASWTINKDNYSLANTTLNLLGGNNEEDNFYLTQMVWKNQKEVNYQTALSNETKANLTNIAESATPSAAYARTILLVKEGVYFGPEMEEVATVYEEENEQKEMQTDAFSINPNPSIDKIIITLPDEVVRLEIYSIQGKRLKIIEQPEYQLALSKEELGVGTFIARIQTSEKTMTKKFILLNN